MPPTQKFLKWEYFVFVCEFRIIEKCNSGKGKEVSTVSKYGKYRYFFLRDHNGNKATQLFRGIHAIALRIYIYIYSVFFIVGLFEKAM